ncbi:putative AC transposase [Glycine soja]
MALGGLHHIMSTPMVGDERNAQLPPTTNQPMRRMLLRKRKKTSSVWNDFDEVEIVGAGKKTICKHCKVRLSTGGLGGSTSHLRRHSEKCNERRLHMAEEKNQSIIPFKPSNLSNSLDVGFPIWKSRLSKKKNRLKALLKTVNKISLTTDMWKSCHQVVEYMVVTGHFIDCLKAWGIKENVFYVSVDNASYIDSYLKNLKENLSLSTKLVLNGDLFHVRCCAHILNLLVQDGLEVWRVKQVIDNALEDEDFFMRDMTGPMKLKFDNY